MTQAHTEAVLCWVAMFQHKLDHLQAGMIWTQQDQHCHTYQLAAAAGSALMAAHRDLHREGKLLPLAESVLESQ